jgi:hypothetical protein
VLPAHYPTPETFRNRSAKTMCTFDSGPEGPALQIRLLLKLFPDFVRRPLAPREVRAALAQQCYPHTTRSRHEERRRYRSTGPRRFHKLTTSVRSRQHV